MRLIDADAQYDRLADELLWLMNFGDDVYLAVGEAIRNQPTAYDIDKVVKELNDLVIPIDKKQTRISLDRAIEIVKQGLEQKK